MYVEICDRSYFDKLGIDYGSIKNLTAQVVADFKLNLEQERAFRIVAHHSVGCTLNPLLLYIGGMGGTGKSQVIKALLSFFQLQDNSYAIVTCAPTGNASALLGGSMERGTYAPLHTYHFLLGINNQEEEIKNVKMAQVCERLKDINYVVLDEVSMLSCYDLYRISEQLCKAKNKPEDSFGG
ncbi:hypothetical protein EV360DRAFT_55409, partial [Lentinula raphanica]